MRGGEHLQNDEAQLTEAELTLYKYQNVYNFPLEQAALTTIHGKVLDYNVGDEHSVGMVSNEFAKMYGASFDEHRNSMRYSNRLLRKLKSSVHMHTHPFPNEPTGFLKNFQATPGRNDLFCCLYYSPLQDLIIASSKIVIMQPPIENRILWHNERYKHGEAAREVQKCFYDGSGYAARTMGSTMRCFLGTYFKSNYGNITYPTTIEEALHISVEDAKTYEVVRTNAALIEFCLESGMFGISVRFLQEIDISTGVGKVVGFSDDIFRMIREIFSNEHILIDRFQRRSILDPDGNLILPEWY